MIGVTLNIGATNTSIAGALLATKSTAGVAAGDNQSSAILNAWGVALIVNMVINMTISKIIPANYYYKLISNNTGTGALTVASWDETDL